MHLTLVHNPEAGEECPPKEDLLAWFEEAGHTVRYQSSQDKDCPEALAEPGELVVVAGGDGTVRKIALRLAGRKIPLAILPIGTANNIARALGVQGPARDLIDQLDAAVRRPCDLGVISGRGGEKRFIEAVGWGLFAQMIGVSARTEKAAGNHKNGRSARMNDAVQMLLDILFNFPAVDYELKIDGRSFSGRYIWVELMNIRSIGPRLVLAPEANPGDGKLDLVLLPENRRKELARELLSQAHLDELAFPQLVRLQGRAVQVACEGARLHIDDSECPGWAGDSASEVRVEPGAVEFLVQPRA